MRNFLSLTMCFLFVGTAYVSLPRQSLAAELLTIGSTAPPLNVEHWVQNGNGKFKPVTKFEKDKVYVVEFWATWCGPCINSMPHLAALQTELADKGVQIVSISDEDLETVEKFLDRELRTQGEPAAAENAAKKTYRDLTSAYCLTTDPDQSSQRDYMEAAAQGGIPTAFIVGKDAKVEWIGHPMEMDGPLSAVINDSWDRAAFAKEIQERQEAEKLMQDVFALFQKGDFEGSVKLIDAAMAKSETMQLKLLKLQVLIASKNMEATATHLQAIYKELSDQPETIDMIAWKIYEMAAQGDMENGSLLDISISALEATLNKAEGQAKASQLDTIGHLYFTQGKLDKAIEAESAAAKISDDREIARFLKELTKAKQDAPEAPAAK